MADLNTYQQMQDFLDRHFLSKMDGESGEFDWIAFSIASFTTDEIDREFARGYLRSLRSRGLSAYERGLWSEDGMPAGSGYRITEAGRERLAQIEREGSV